MLEMEEQSGNGGAVKQCNEKCQLGSSCNLLHSVNRSDSEGEEKKSAQNLNGVSLEHNISSLCLTKIDYFLFMPTPIKHSLSTTYSHWFPLHFVLHENNKVFYTPLHSKNSGDF